MPKEHGAWAVLYGAFLAGVGVAGHVTFPVALFLVGVTAAAFANGTVPILARPVIGRAQSERRRHAFRWLLVYGGAAVVVFVPLLVIFRMTFLLPFGVGAAMFLLLRAFLIRERDDRTLAGELVGTAGLTMVGAAAHAVAAGGIHRTGAVVWLLLFLFFASGVFHVRLRIHGMLAERKRVASPDSSLWPLLLSHGLLVLVVLVLSMARIIPWPVLLAFAPALWRAPVGLHRGEAPLSVRRLGWSEVALATAFVLLLIGAFWLQGPAS